MNSENDTNISLKVWKRRNFNSDRLNDVLKIPHSLNYLNWKRAIDTVELFRISIRSVTLVTGQERVLWHAHKILWYVSRPIRQKSVFFNFELSHNCWWPWKLVVVSLYTYFSFGIFSTFCLLSIHFFPYCRDRNSLWTWKFCDISNFYFLEWSLKVTQFPTNELICIFHNWENLKLYSSHKLNRKIFFLLQEYVRVFWDEIWAEWVWENLKTENFFLFLWIFRFFMITWTRCRKHVVALIYIFSRYTRAHIENNNSPNCQWNVCERVEYSKEYIKACNAGRKTRKYQTQTNMCFSALLQFTVFRYHFVFVVVFWLNLFEFWNYFLILVLYTLIPLSVVPSNFI